MGTSDMINGTCELCHGKGELRAGQVFTKGEENSIDGPHKEKGFPYFEFVVMGHKDCIKNLEKLTPHLDVKDTDVYIKFTKSNTGRIPFGIHEETIIVTREASI